MRITKTRLMRGPTINPNPPICKSKEPSYTLINIYSCADDHKIKTIEHYNWNWTDAHQAANGGSGTYTLGYFYEAAFKKYTSLAQRHCPQNVYLQAYFVARPGDNTIVHTSAFGRATPEGKYATKDTGEAWSPRNIRPFDTWKIIFDKYTPQRNGSINITFYQDFFYRDPLSNDLLLPRPNRAAPMPPPTSEIFLYLPELP